VLFAAATEAAIMTEVKDSLSVQRSRATRRSALLGVGAFVSGLGAGPAMAQAFPSRPVRIVVPFTPGGPVDILARALGEALQGPWGQSVVVENRPGGGGTIGANAVARAAPDGHTLLLVAVSHVMNPPFMPTLPYDPVKDFTPIMQVAYLPYLLAVHPSVPAHSLPELIAIAKADPGGVSVGTAGFGTGGHLASALLGSMAGVEFNHIHFQGAAPLQAAVIGGQIKAAFLNISTALPAVQSGGVRPLATTGLRRWRQLPDVPTGAEQGYPGYETISWFGVMGPSGLPAPLLAKLHTDIAAALQTPTVQRQLTNNGLDPMDTGPGAFAELVPVEIARWTRVVREAGIRTD
jgi:tripartite-type tricarboxylate transporter receptor subunit TctC